MTKYNGLFRRFGWLVVWHNGSALSRFDKDMTKYFLCVFVCFRSLYSYYYFLLFKNSVVLYCIFYGTIRFKVMENIVRKPVHIWKATQWCVCRSSSALVPWAVGQQPSYGTCTNGWVILICRFFRNTLFVYPHFGMFISAKLTIINALRILHPGTGLCNYLFYFFIRGALAQSLKGKEAGSLNHVWHIWTSWWCTILIFNNKCEVCACIPVFMVSDN